MAGSTKYKNEWQKANLDRISLTVPKGQKEQIQDHASAHGETLNGFINQAICEAMEREHIFEQDKEEIIAIAQKYNVALGEHEVKKLAQAFAILEPQFPNIKSIYFSKLQQQDFSSGVLVITRDGSVQ